MERLYIQKTDFSPEIVFDYINNDYHISGESRLEHVRKFYEPIFEWFKVFFTNKGYLKNSKNITIVFSLEYFNSTSAKVFFDFLLMLKKMQDENNINFTILWQYSNSDLDLFESGKLLEELTKLKFEYKQID